MLEKAGEEDFKFGFFQRTKHCINCSHYEYGENTSAKVYYLNLDAGIPSEQNTQQLIDSSLHRRRHFFDCSCDTKIRRPMQYETIRYSEYPKILVLLPTESKGDANLHIDLEISMPNTSKYTLAGFFLSYGDQYECVGKIDEVFYDLAKKQAVDIAAKQQCKAAAVRVFLYVAK
eukprot:Phypoly_transcript_09940.p1 GENE.Phypoly_transcript_09940~~Phypoly_transcript_09940.p1  ORF type:complete len:174 (+),score=22.92 Phypoly_transcript_09940:529-1050(+)